MVSESEARFLPFYIHSISIKCIPCRYLDNGYHDNSGGKMVANWLQLYDILTTERPHPVYT